MSCGKATVVSYSYFTSTLIISWDENNHNSEISLCNRKNTLKAIYFENQYEMAKNKYLLQFKVIEI